MKYYAMIGSDTDRSTNHETQAWSKAGQKQTDRLMWYGYYIPIIITPLLSLIVSLSIGGKSIKKDRWYLLPLRITCAVLLILILTNDIPV